MSLATTAANRSLLGFESAAGLLLLLTIYGTGLSTIRVARNAKDIVSRGNTFLAYPFDLAWSTDGEESPRVSLRIANVDRRITDALLSLKTAPSFKVEAVLSSSVNTVERTLDFFTLRGFEANAISVSAELTQERFSTEPWPKLRATPSLTPVLFR
jgi:hypothetical protein